MHSFYTWRSQNNCFWMVLHVKVFGHGSFLCAVCHAHACGIFAYLCFHTCLKELIAKIKKELAGCNFNCRLVTMFDYFVLVLLQWIKRWWDLGLVFWPEPMWYVLLLVSRLIPQSVCIVILLHVELILNSFFYIIDWLICLLLSHWTPYWRFLNLSVSKVI